MNLTRHYNISHHLLRTALCLALLLCVSLGAGAQTQTRTLWENQKQVKPAGTGAEDDPYVIATAENLLWLTMNVRRNIDEHNPLGAAGTYFVQTADINLSAHDEWIPIGNINGGFHGDYDGQGHTISGMRVNWNHYAKAVNGNGTMDTGTTTANSYGLFGWLGGSVRNLVIEGAVLYRGPREADADDGALDMKIGVLAGQAGNGKNMEIHNIVVRDCQIRDYYETPLDVEHRLLAAAYMVGGLLGDIHSAGTGATTATAANVKYDLNSIYCDVNIDMANTPLSDSRDWGNKGQQYYVGGIIGRVRSMRVADQMPKKAIFTGTINAPQAFVGPIFASARTSNSDVTKYAGYQNQYAGDFADKASGTAANIDYFKEAYFYDYKVYDYSLSNEAVQRTINGTDVPSNTNTLGTRTFAEQTSFTPSATAPPTNQQMAMFQGVNRGTYLASESDMIGTANNDFGFSTDEFEWRFTSSSKDFGRENSVSLSLTHNSYATFTASFDTQRSAQTGYHIVWYYQTGSAGWSSAQTQVKDEELSGTSSTQTKVKGEKLSGTSSTLTAVFANAGYLTAVLYDGRVPLEAQVIEVDKCTVSFDMALEANSPFIIVTPKVVITDSEGHEQQVDVAAENLTLSVEVADNSNVVQRTFDNSMSAYFSGQAFRLPPTLKSDARLTVVVATEASISLRSAFKVANTVYSQIGGLVRTSKSEGQLYTDTLKTCAGLVFPYSDDLEFTYVWDVKDQDPELDWNKIAASGVTDDGVLWALKDDHSLKSRDIRLTVTDFYGFSSNKTAGINVTNNRTISGVTGEFQTYRFEYKWTGGTVLKPNLSRYIDYKYYINADNENLIPFGTDGIITCTNDVFTINRVHFVNRDYHVRMFDKYGYVFTGDKGDNKEGWPFSSTQTCNAPTAISIVSDGEKLVPEFTISKVNRRFKQTEWGLTYNWTVQFYDAANVLIGDKTQMFDTDEISNIGYVKADRVVVKLDAEDFLGNTMSKEMNYSIKDIFVDVVQTGDAPNYTFTAKVKNFTDFPMDYNGTWQWYGVNGEIVDDLSKFYLLQGETSNTLTLNSTNNNYTAYCIVFNSTDEDLELRGYVTKKDVVYVYNWEQTVTFNNADSRKRFDYLVNDVTKYPDGNDANLGRTPSTAVKTMARAYEIISEKNRAADNIIVVMGYQGDNTYLHYCGKDVNGKTLETYEHHLNNLSEGKFNRDATITGSYGEIKDGTVLFQSDGDTGTKEIYNGIHAIDGATIFRDITFYGGNNGNRQMHFYCHLHDLTIGNGVKVEGFNDMSANTNGLPDAKATFTTFVGGFHNFDNRDVDYPESNAVAGQTTITITSGCWGRIIAGSRNAGGSYDKKSHNIFRHPDNPHRVEVKVAIKHNSSGLNEYTPDKNTTTQYTYDIGLLVGGQTDGTVYSESKTLVMSGKIGRYISGNISYGRAVGGTHPSDGYFGSTTLTLEGGEIGELVGGILGRQDATVSTNKTEKSEAYFYGRSILNINSGIINGNIYGAGAGGVTGIGDDDRENFHTKDEHIPYIADADGSLSYGDYETVKANGKMPKMEMLAEDKNLEVDIATGKRNILDLAKSYSEVNINGGIVNGAVFGGGYGYSVQVDITKALDQAGYLFGRSFVNISGGTIKGNVYGGGAGATDFYDKAKKDANIDETKFSDLANIFGDTHVNITGGIIEGKVFAGSMGISGFPKMATLYGNTNLNIENVTLSDNTTRVPIINGNIYGGSELGEITGDTHVTIAGGAIGNCIFGGSEGIEADYTEKGVTYKKTTAHIGGDTKVEITGGTYFTDVHNQKISSDNRLAPKDRTFNIYGGGYKNCVIAGNTNVKITKSLFTSKDNLLETDKYPTFLDCVNDKTYRKFSVYGAGRGELTVVEKDANLQIEIEGGQVVPSKMPETLAKEQQFFMIAGGGFAGNVWGNTFVHLDGYVFARRIYGGGMYGNIYGASNLTVHGGSYHGVFGGGLLGDIQKGANLTFGLRVGDKLSDGTEITAAMARNKNRFLYVYENVYGGNDVGGCTGYDFTSDRWDDGNGVNYPIEHPNTTIGDGEYKRLVRASETYGVNMKIYGGTILGDVFGAGNGNHMGYYVPNKAKSEHYSNPDDITRMMFFEGPAYLYRVNKKDKNSYVGTPYYDELTNSYFTDETKQSPGTLHSVLNPTIREHYGLYEYRPRVGKVEMHIGGNSDEDRVSIGGDVFGGGHACTIGKYDPTKDVLTDPLRFEGGGLLHMNYGSHVRVGGSVYMGSRGRIIGEQTVIEAADVYKQTTLNSDYDYHYYDPKQDKYLLGFPNTLEGRKRFHAYMKLVNMDAEVSLTFDDPITKAESTDLRWGSFFAGGARGSMTKKILAEDDKEIIAAGGKTSDLYKKTRPYEFTLPAGLTVETRVVGGSEEADITYYQYKGQDEGNPDFEEIDKTKPLFTFYGGIVYDSRLTGHYGGGRVKWHDESYASSTDTQKSDGDKMVGDESPRGSLTVMKLNVNCQFDPQKATAPDGEQYWGGLVYGGCYNSGITNGSVEVTCSNSLLGSVDADFDGFQDYLAASSLRRNVGRVYGGGFGENSDILGNTKVHLTGNFRAFNVFGGGMMGNVIGGTEITIDGKSYIYNAVYGGGMRGNVGLSAEEYQQESGSELWPYQDIHSASGTHINLISGGIDRVYGGAFMGDVYGGTHIEANDKTATRLMIGSIYGGNDVSGKVNKDLNQKLADGTTANSSYGLCTDIHITETPIAEKKNYYLSEESATGSGLYYGGYPMIGTVYGAGNGNMADYIAGVYINKENHKYQKGKIHIANGKGVDYDVYDFEKLDMALPDVETSSIKIEGGTIINVYGGGSMCTTTDKDEIIIDYKNSKVRAAYLTKNKDSMTWGVLRLFNDIQQSEVTENLTKEETTTKTEDGVTTEETTTKEYTQFSHQIYRVFGGNNLMDMDIQPTWNLQSGHIFSVYSGGNFGKMTYCKTDVDVDYDVNNPDPTKVHHTGLSLTINPTKKNNLRISSVYGGGRVGDIDAIDKTTKESITFGDSEYGATLNIQNGIIGDVYGGNNVAGNVRNGTNVNISGAISGNVYGSGNGNYIYLYDWNEDHKDPNLTVQQISEGYDEKYGGRYFILPKKVAYEVKDGSGNVTNTVYYGNSDEEKILAINRYRPNVEKAYLKIEGSESSPVFVRGNVFCGGNSSTVLYNPSNPGDIKFKIGDYVTLGGVFLGSNGEGLANDDEFHITYLSELNNIDLTKPNKIAERAGFQFTTPAEVEASPLYFNDKASYDTSLYPNVLSLYMRAAEVTALPSNFNLPKDAEHAYIGNFTLGGNYGSMMTDKTIDITIPENLTIFGRVVGGCYNSLVEYHKAKAVGGMTKPLSTDINTKTGNKYIDDGKVRLTIKSKFRPWRLDYNEETHAIRLVDDLMDNDGNPVDAAYYATHPDSTYYTEGLCNIFGGCYTSGKTVGDISIDLYSDVLGYYENGKNWDAVETETIDGVEHKRRKVVDRDILMNNVSQRRTVYAVTGGGYGALSELEGNTHIRLLPTNLPDFHPTISTIFGGAHNGKQTGNSTTEIRDGMVFSNIYAGSRAAFKYGSSEVIVGYPIYYICKESGEFTLNRADDYSYVAQAANATDKKYTTPGGKTYHAYNEYKENGVKKTAEVIKKTVKYRKGDIVAANVYEQITNSEKSTKFDIVVNVDKLEDFVNVDNIENVEIINPTTFGTSWDNIDINIGDNSQMNDPSAHFYGGGGIYGGGHAINESAISYSGINTQLAFDAGHNPENDTESTSIGYGGNSTISIGDDTAGDKSHISIGTAHYVKLNLKPTDDKISTYLKKTEGGKTTFVHQSSGTPESGKEYYKMETDGGVFGDGRRTFVQNFRAVDITGYGYADYTPQSAKLINTFQRIDILSLTDCCLQLQGAKDYATNTIDATYYSISRIGELRMNSSLNSAGKIEQSVADGENIGNMSLNVKKSRNYLGFFKKVHYVGALYSNTSFDDKYRSNSGKQESQTYREKKQEYITAYENVTEKTPEVEKAFTKRNFGSAPNMIGINNGYTLTIQNAFTTVKETSSTPTPAPTRAEGEPGTGSGTEEDESTMLSNTATDNIYYGPIVGVVEVKLLTVQADEGGGYIYALNHHADKTSPATGKTFLEDTGNFIFAAKVEGSSDENYIIDDCYPFGYYASNDNATKEEAHYWYVKGHNYFFNTTLTGYTYDKPIDFYLNNADALILLSGITASNASTIKVESVNWRDHADIDEDTPYKSALMDNLNESGTDSRDKYQLFLSIDAKTDKKYDLTSHDNAFVARIPNGNGTTANGLGTDGEIRTAGPYKNIDADTQNNPLLGIRLHDTDTDNNDPTFYKSHLSDEDYVVIKIKALESGTEGASDAIYNTYTINLTINYLQGPYIRGNVNIENCALPGEYIYANTEGITMLMDEELTVTGKRWYLYPKIRKTDTGGTNPHYEWDTDNKIDVTNYVKQDVAGDINRLQLPARYYQNDWQLDYVVEVNGQEFGLNNSAMDIPRLTVHNYHRMSTLAEEVKNMTDTERGVGETNYGYDLDLDLVGGALVYIESNEDFELFTKYVNYCNGYRTTMIDATEVPEGYTINDYKIDGGVLWQRDKKPGTEHWAKVMRAEVLPGFNRQGGVTGFVNNNTVFGYDDDTDVLLQNVKNPSGAENIRFVLTTDIETTANCMPLEQFRGRLNGNGHVIHFKSGYHNSNFIAKNYGSLDYVGFVSSGGEDTDEHTTAIVFDNYGQVNNCFYYNYSALASGEDIDYSKVDDAAFIGSNYASLVQNIEIDRTAGDSRLWVGSVDNCYQNTDRAQTVEVHTQAVNKYKGLSDAERELLINPEKMVRGKLSYRSSQSFHNGMIAYNLNLEYLKARWKSHDDDALVREQMVASSIDENDKYIEGDYLYNYYADGEYRYAYVYDVNDHPEALRLAASLDGWPNYEDRMRTGKSMHKSSEDVGHDERRWFTTTRDDLIQIDERGQIMYEEKTMTVGDNEVKRIVPVTANTGYFPLYLHDADNTLADHSDFIFFGQRITADKSKREYFPNHINYANRVYRASGTYGSRVDYGYHFNRDAEVIVPQTTAIDFSGSLDLKESDGTPQYKERWQYYVKAADGSTLESDTYYPYDDKVVEYVQDDVTGKWSYSEKVLADELGGDALVQLIFYPPLLDLPGGDRPENLHNIKSFKVDSNVATETGKENIDSHGRITRNLLVYTPAIGDKYVADDEERLFDKLHYTRMQDWGQTETDQNDIIGHHIELVKHTGGEHFHAHGGLFHLVDKQDFNAPIDFYVVGDGDEATGTNGRAWYLRKPEHYASRNKTLSNGFVISKDAWESISLPFTANRVWALNTEYDINGNFSPTNVYSRGEITHFYGSDPKWGITHHDYWLRGLVDGAIDNHSDDIKCEANFARPGESYKDADNNEVKLFELPKEDVNGDGVEDTQMRGDYSYLYQPINGKSWFAAAYGKSDGIGGYMDEHSDYDEVMPFTQYPYLTKNAPYIVTYPGEDYYEFDLTGKFYKKMNDTEACQEQTIMYEFSVDKIDPNNNFTVSDKNVLIPITDIYNSVRTTSVTGTGINLTHNATFSCLSGTQIKPNMYVLNETEVESVNAHGATVDIPAGSAFINCKDFGITEILPFRTYLTADVPASGSAKPRYIMVGDGTRGIDNLGDEDSDEEENRYSGVNLYVRGNELVITSDHDFQCPLYGYSGSLYRMLTVKAGMNVYKNLNSGVYIALGHKFVVRR